jgi:hypothetical protein
MSRVPTPGCHSNAPTCNSAHSQAVIPSVVEESAFPLSLIVILNEVKNLLFLLVAAMKRPASSSAFFLDQ